MDLNFSCGFHALFPNDWWETTISSLLPEVTSQLGITAPRTAEENQLRGILAMPIIMDIFASMGKIMDVSMSNRS